MTPPGIYKHYKGALYRVLFNALESTNGLNVGRELVVYVSLTRGTIHVRTDAEFNEPINVGDDRVFRFSPAHVV